MTEHEFRKLIHAARGALAVADQHRRYLPDAVPHLESARDIITGLERRARALALDGTRLRP